MARSFRSLRVIAPFAFCVMLPISLPARLRAQTLEPIAPGSLLKLRTLEAEKEARSPAERKLSSDLLAAVHSAGQASVVPDPTAPPVAAGSGETRSVDITGPISGQLLEAVKDAGGTVNAVLPDAGLLNAEVPISALNALASRPDVNSISSAAKPRLNKLDVALQDRDGDLAHQANEARQTYKVDGSGVAVCVVSDGVNHLNEAQARGSLGPVEILQGQAGPATGSEGTAMLEIVHSIAPGANLKFATGFTSEATMAQNIIRLADAGCNIVVDDVTYFDESPFQDSYLSLAVNKVSTRGVLFFSSASNSGSKKHETSGVWEGDFRDGGPVLINGAEVGRYHQFEAGPPGIATSNPLIGSIISNSTVDLFWNDPLGKASNEYTLYVTDAKGRLSAVANTSATGGTQPYQTTAASAGQRIVIIKAKDAAPRHLYLDTNGLILKYATSGSIRGHNGSGAENAFSVAAVNVPVPNAIFAAGNDVSVAEYSSDGPRHLYYEASGSPISTDLTSAGGRLLNKPDFTAADGVTTDVPGFAPFRGTSAAAPHAAAIAALLKSYRPNASPAELRAALMAGCLRIEGGDYNFNSGAGILMPAQVLSFATSHISEQPSAIAATSRQP